MTVIITLLRRWPRVALPIAAALALVACEEDTAPPFATEGVGGVEGILFFDADRNAAFDPSAGDTVVAGATVLVRNRGTEDTFEDAQAVTDAAGRFEVQGLPPGTHDLFVDTMTVAAGVAFCQNPLPVSIAINLTRFAAVAGREGCVIPIADAEALGADAFVTIQGVVTAAPGQLRSAGDNAYIEDASGGVLLFGGDLSGRGIEVGDLIEVSGTLSLFNGEFEVAGTLRVNDVVKAFTTPQAALVTTSQVATAGTPSENPLQGTFLRVLGAEQISAFSTGGGRNAQFDDGSGAMEVRIESGLVPTASNVAAMFPPGKCYDVTGVLGSFNGVAQLKPRTLADMEEVPCN